MGHGDPELHRLATKKELDRRRDSRQVTYLHDPSICGDQEAAFEKHRDGDQNSDRCERSPKFKVNAFRAHSYLKPVWMISLLVGRHEEHG